jgi:hypothetical protein
MPEEPKLGLLLKEVLILDFRKLKLKLQLLRKESDL